MMDRILPSGYLYHKTITMDRRIILIRLKSLMVELPPNSLFVELIFVSNPSVCNGFTTDDNLHGNKQYH